MLTGMTVLRLGKDGESTFVALQFYYAMTILKEFAEYKKDKIYEISGRKSEEAGKIDPGISVGMKTALSVALQRMERLSESRTDPRQICG